MEYTFGDFYNRVMSQPPIKKEQIQLDYRSNLKEKLSRFSSLESHEQSTLIKNNLEMISDDILNNDVTYASLLKSIDFIDALDRVVTAVPLEYRVQLAINKISYDYFTSENPDSKIKELYLKLSKSVNSHYINQLTALGLDETTASNFALCRFSSANEKTNVKRLNFAMYCKDPIIMTDQMIVWIYEKLFNRIYDLFEATMFETYTKQQQADFGSDFMEIYGTVGLAVLIILNNMRSEDIRRVLLKYSIAWEYKRIPVRFSLHALSGDYSRISRVVDVLTAEGYNIP